MNEMLSIGRVGGWEGGVIYLVGARSKARGPLPFFLAWGPRRRRRVGRTKAAVLPLPVGAEARRSRPAVRAGMACLWVWVGGWVGGWVGR